jgi:hypothetical protein
VEIIMTQARKVSAEEFCRAFDAWAHACMTALDTDSESTTKWREQFREHWQFIELSIRKSCLLDRLIYGGDVLRTIPCPVHQGKWSGISTTPCPHCAVGPCACNTGWLPEPGVSTEGASARVD